jgi:2,3-dihydroxyphenylpropionate 1,2-dioxygenase
MAQVVGGIGISHAPGWLAWPEAAPPAQKRAVADATARVARYLDDARPDFIVALLDDHFENLYRSLMPTFAIGVAEAHSGPADYWMEALGMTEKLVFPGVQEVAGELLEGMIAQNFDVARAGAFEFGNNVLVPWTYIRPQNDIPIIPVMINIFTPPLPRMERAYAFGQALRRAIEALPGDKRVVVMATGGLSHWPPFWMEHHDQQDPFLHRMQRYQTEGRAVLESDANLMVDLAAYEIEMAATSNRLLVNDVWDRAFLDALARRPATVGTRC